MGGKTYEQEFGYELEKLKVTCSCFDDALALKKLEAVCRYHETH